MKFITILLWLCLAVPAAAQTFSGGGGSTGNSSIIAGKTPTIGITSGDLIGSSSSRAVDSGLAVGLAGTVAVTSQLVSTPVAPQYGGTGENNGTDTLAPSENIAFSGGGGSSYTGTFSVPGGASSTWTLPNTNANMAYQVGAWVSGDCLQANGTVGGIADAGAACSSGGGSATIVAPQGRLTLQSGAAVQKIDETGVGTIYYTGYIGNSIPWYNGSAWSIETFTSDLSLTLDSTNTVSGDVYDVYYTNSSGNVLCYAGPWSNTASRGSTYAVTRLNDLVWVNSGSSGITCRENSSTTVSIAQYEGTYLGTFYAVASGETSVTLQPAAASGGAANCICLSNGYNSVRVTAINVDSTSSWTYNGGWHSTDASTSNRISWIDGLQQSYVVASNSETFYASGATAFIAAVGVNFDSTTSPTGSANFTGSLATTTGFTTCTNSNATCSTSGNNSSYPKLGFHYAQAMEYGNSNNVTYVGGAQSQLLTLTINY